MKNQTIRKMALLLLTAMLWVCGVFASAESLSADNSLSSLGITTEGATVSPDFAYGTTEYNVTVPAGTTSLSLDPVTTNSAASIDSISGTELTDGATTVSITVVAENGDAYTYYLYVTEEESTAAAESEVQTEAQTEEETEEETEDPRYVSVARETLEEAENTITALKTETSSYRDRVDLLMKILYGMIGLCVVLLFSVINLLLKKRDMKAELKAYRGLSYSKDRKKQEPERWEESPEQPDTFYEQEPPAGRKMTDDPMTVPKPSKAKKKAKKMPEYEPLRESVRYEPQKDSKTDSDDVDIDFIDL